MNKVKLLNLNNNTSVEYTLVGETEANLREGKLAAATPIGKALIGKKKGDVVEVIVPSGKIRFEVLEISETYGYRLDVGDDWWWFPPESLEKT